jgi:hypothetical protein
VGDLLDSVIEERSMTMSYMFLYWISQNQQTGTPIYMQLNIMNFPLFVYATH